MIVIFLFEFRVYYKFNRTGGFNLRSTTLQCLSRQHIFLIINYFGIRVTDIHIAYDEALKERLLLVGRRDNPGQEKDDVGVISVDELREYVLNYDVHTGKRKADIGARSEIHSEYK